MTTWAIIVGINEYGPYSGLRPLHGAVADAADFADWLLDPQGGGVAPERLFFWTHPAPRASTPRIVEFMQNPTRWPVIGPDFTHAPTFAELINGITEINRKATAAGATRLYVYFAGHGAQTQAQSISEDPQNCFITGEFIQNVPSVGLINCDDMRRYLKSQGPEEIIIFADCCRNPLPLKVKRPGTGFNDLAPNGNHLRLGVGRAAQDECVAYEIPIDAPQPERGAFTHLLTYGLREIRVNDELTLKTLEAYVTEGLKEIVKPKIQVPDFDEKPRPPRIVIATGPPAGNPAHVHIVFRTQGDGIEVEVRDKNAALVQTITTSDRRQALSLPIGVYSLERGGAILAVFNHIGPGTPDVVV
ncbi:caspase family protein [Labrys sp. KB_33_2]|uniref:caspase family protein n=1 Tax=Labrys sp. KB_33_2 TaxID=3237479 RepID=UPI003F926637